MTTDTQRHMQLLHEIARIAVDRACPDPSYSKTTEISDANVYATQITSTYIKAMRALLEAFPAPANNCNGSSNESIVDDEKLNRRIAEFMRFNQKRLAELSRSSRTWPFQ